MSSTGLPADPPGDEDVQGADARGSSRAPTEVSLPYTASTPLQQLIDLSRKPLRDGMERTTQETAWLELLENALLASCAPDAEAAFDRGWQISIYMLISIF
jgi:hypothetical protein